MIDTDFIAEPQFEIKSRARRWPDALDEGTTFEPFGDVSVDPHQQNSGAADNRPTCTTQ